MDINQHAWKPDIPEDRKCSHLFLLIGSNSLPNAVAAKCLIQEDATYKCIYLIHTNETKAIAEKLQKWIVSNNLATDEHFCFVHIDPSGAESIYPKICDCLNKLNDQASNLTVGLHYTGGTSAMGIHAYRAMEDWAKEVDVRPVFSYLDARTQEVCFDPKDISVGQTTQRIYVGRVHVELEELIDLHGWTWQNDPVTEPVLPEVTKQLAKVYHDDKGCKWRGSWSESSGHISLLPDQGCNLVKVAVHILACRLKQLDVKMKDMRFDSREAKSAVRFKPYDASKDFSIWLNGEWMDSYCLDCVKSIQDEVGLDEVVMDLRAQEVDFQSDVIALRGYQLFHFSCSVQSRKVECKQNLFEAYIRARQLAGDHARVALVCCTGEPNIISEEVKQALQTEGQIHVFGRSSLINLASEIKDWINLNKGNDPGGGY